MASLDARRRSRRVVAEATWLPSRLDGVDVVHHGGGTVPPRSPGPIVLTIHDLQYRTLPRVPLAGQAAVPAAGHPPVGQAGHRRHRPEEYVRGTVIEAYGHEPERVVVVPHGVDVPDAVTDDDELRARYGLGERRYVVYPAVTHPHKNHRSCSISWPGRGTTRSWHSSCSADAGSSRTTSRRRSGGSA